ncbi:arylsulfatase regulatory protein [Vibrio ishigakensis]|uniref:Arylsulfatase regulatory protein n=1 Tax=Vibrio ishigakensis TaxID=1481914 RepID=A0A0B8P463_9VIBR|nr:arylsulfatase regulatory protein [Vibrio ishigakensis]
MFIPYFDNFFAVWAGQASSMCTLSEICGKGLAIEPMVMSTHAITMYMRSSSWVTFKRRA